METVAWSQHLHRGMDLPIRFVSHVPQIYRVHLCRSLWMVLHYRVGLLPPRRSHLMVLLSRTGFSLSSLCDQFLHQRHRFGALPCWFYHVYTRNLKLLHGSPSLHCWSLFCDLFSSMEIDSNPSSTQQNSTLMLKGLIYDCNFRLFGCLWSSNVLYRQFCLWKINRKRRIYDDRGSSILFRSCWQLYFVNNDILPLLLRQKTTRKRRTNGWDQIYHLLSQSLIHI